jgi:maltose alpha-D-glucosyltransferase/alpha-amylase
MQWSPEDNGGFSTVPPKAMVRPQPGGAFGPGKVNVADQRRDADSLLNHIERLIRRRKETPEFGWGESTLIETAAPSVFAHRCDWQGSTVVAVHNLSSKRVSTELPLGEGIAGIDDLLTTARHRPRRDGTLPVELDGYGALWLRVRRDGERTLS